MSFKSAAFKINQPAKTYPNNGSTLPNLCDLFLSQGAPAHSLFLNSDILQPSNLKSRV